MLERHKEALTSEILQFTVTSKCNYIFWLSIFNYRNLDVTNDGEKTNLEQINVEEDEIEESINEEILEEGERSYGKNKPKKDNGTE